MRILAVCGSLQAQSSNLTLLRAAEASAPPGVEVVVFDGLRELPLFNPDVEALGAPDSVDRWRRALAGSDAVLVASPEYGHSLPGSLKNAIDWVIGSGELERKIVAITAAVPGEERGRRGLQALRDTLAAVRATIVGGVPIPRGPRFEEHVASLVRALVEAVDTDRALRAPGDRPHPSAPPRALLDIRAFEGDRAALLGLFRMADDSERQIAAYIDAGEIITALDGDAIVGHVQLVGGADGGATELKSVAVAEHRRGAGIGRALVEDALRRSRERGVPRLVVAAAAADVGTLRFYQRLGFRLWRIERDAFGREHGYPDDIEIGGVPLRDRVWLERMT